MSAKYIFRRVLCATFFAISCVALFVGISQADPVKRLDFKADQVPKAIKFKGKLMHGVHWLDQMGENYALFSTTTREKSDHSSIYLYVHHYVKSEKGTYRLARRIRDKEEQCPFENLAHFAQKSVELTDLDQDQIGELSFVYHLGCAGDMSPHTAKLVTLEKGSKYIIRGTTKIKYPARSEGGERKIDPSFLKAPKPILNHALKMWEAHTVTSVGH